jgi:hypothetical protein
MPKSRLLVVVLALLALFVAPSLASAAEPAQWTVNTATGAPLPAVDYQLVNTGGGSRIGYQDRTGVDLGWTSSGGNFQFIRAGAQPGVRDHRAFKPEEAVALYNTKTKRYLAYGSQTFGINLDWSSAPQFQWKVRQAGPRFTLYNTVAHDYVVYGSRTWGINLVWAGLPNAEDGYKQKSVVLTTAHTFFDGFQQFSGATGQDQFDLLLKVQNAGGVPLNFLKCNVELSCSLTNAVWFTLAPGATMTAAQMQTAFGTATPKVPRNLSAWIKDPNPVTQTYLNITYIDR